MAGMFTNVKKSISLLYIMIISGISSEITSSVGENQLQQLKKIVEDKKSSYDLKHQENNSNEHLEDVDDKADKEEILFGQEDKCLVDAIGSSLFEVLVNYHNSLVRDLETKEKSPQSFVQSMSALQKVIESFDVRRFSHSMKKKVKTMDEDRARREKRENKEKMVIGDISDRYRQGLRDAITETLDQVKRMGGLEKKLPAMAGPLEELRGKLKQLEVDVEDRPTKQSN